MIPNSLPESVLQPFDSAPISFSGAGSIDEEDILHKKELEYEKMESQRSIRFIKDDWIRRQMKDCEGDFINTIPLRIFVGTFNANGKKISSPLEPWLSWPVVGRNPSQSDAQKVIIPDIYGMLSMLLSIHYFCFTKNIFSF